MAALWEDESSDERKKIYFRRLRSDLHTQLDNNVDTILAQQRGMLGVATNEIDCNYYDLLIGKPGAANSYRGKYMAQYSWAETTSGMLKNRIFTKASKYFLWSFCAFLSHFCNAIGGNSGYNVSSNGGIYLDGKALSNYTGGTGYARLLFPFCGFYSVTIFCKGKM